jgi:hypothetical protein
LKYILFVTAALVGNVHLAGCGDQNHSNAEPKSSMPALNGSIPVQDKFENITVKLDSPAFGGVDGINEVISPKVGSTITINNEKIVIAGNFVDAVKGEAAAGVIALIDSKPFIAVYGGERPDIAKIHNNPKYLKSQFYVEVPTVAIGAGVHDLKMRAIAADRSGYYESGVLAKLDVK